MGLNEYVNSKTRLIDTCLFSQDVYKDVIKYLNINGVGPINATTC